MCFTFTHRCIVRIHERGEDGQMITFTCCDTDVRLFSNKSTTIGLPYASSSRPPENTLSFYIDFRRNIYLEKKVRRKIGAKIYNKSYYLKQSEGK